ncbi:DUF1697 domain-containing protein [Gaoshiqia sp. Z1-71]|uniref:DUF1697 domain-containing protein n=1 Tax=Gaoshiqia hydrogeniformans TaxID=3290090 RepID=UPI003BF8D431
MNKTSRQLALLRGINIGGHHKVPMAELSRELEKIGFRNISTVLNSGNVIFDASSAPAEEVEDRIGTHLERVFGFPVPVMVRDDSDIFALTTDNPFQHVEGTKNTRFYLSFLKQAPSIRLNTPWFSDDQSFCILEIRGKTVCSLLDLSVTQTPKGMDALEQLFGKNITTRSWNTIQRIVGKI